MGGVGAGYGRKVASPPKRQADDRCVRADLTHPTWLTHSDPLTLAKLVSSLPLVVLQLDWILHRVPRLPAAVDVP
jgi:hypothetical protein